MKTFDTIQAAIDYIFGDEYTGEEFIFVCAPDSESDETR